MASRVRLTPEEKRAIYEKSLATPGISLAKLAEWARVELGLVRPPGVSSVALVLKQQADQQQARRAARPAAGYNGASDSDSDDIGDDGDDDGIPSETVRRSVRRDHLPSRGPLPELRIRMTLKERSLVFEKFQATPDMKLRDLGKWAAEQFGLDRVPGKSTLSRIIRHQRLEPLEVDVRNHDMTRKNAVKLESVRVESDLLKWIDMTEQLGVSLHGSQIRAYASSLRDELLEKEADPQKREKLAALQFSKKWYYRFQQDRSRIVARAVQSASATAEASLQVDSSVSVGNTSAETGSRDYAW